MHFFSLFNCLDIEKNDEPHITFCESFWTDDGNNKIGVGIVKIEKESVIFLCMIPVNSENYEWNSCSEEYA